MNVQLHFLPQLLHCFNTLPAFLIGFKKFKNPPCPGKATFVVSCQNGFIFQHDLSCALLYQCQFKFSVSTRRVKPPQPGAGLFLALLLQSGIGGLNRVATAQGKQGIWKSIFPDRENTGNLLKDIKNAFLHREFNSNTGKIWRWKKKKSELVI